MIRMVGKENHRFIQLFYIYYRKIKNNKMEKLYYIVDANAPADDSVVKFEEGGSAVSLEVAEAFIAANQSDLEQPILLEEGVEITKRYTLLEVKPVEE